MQKLMIQAQKMQRELGKARDDLAKKEFSVNKNGGVKLSMRGDRTGLKVEINAEMLTPENKEMLEQLIALAYQDVNEAIVKTEAGINEQITGSAGGFGSF